MMDNNNNSPAASAAVTTFCNFSDECLLLGGASADEKLCGDLLARAAEGDFADPDTRALYVAMRTIRAAGRLPDAVNIADYIAKTNIRLNHRLTEILGGRADFGRYEFDAALARIKEKTRFRTLFRAVDGARQSLSKGAEVADVAASLAAAIEAISVTDGFARDYLRAADLAQSVIDTVEAYAKPDWRAKNVIQTGFVNLDSVLCGLVRGNLVLLSGYTGTGKSSFALNLCWRMSAQNHVLYINSEMAQDEVNLRIAAMISGQNHDKLREGKASDDDLYSVLMAADEIAKKGNFDATKIPDLALNKIEETLNFAISIGVQVVVIDYVGRMDLMAAYGRGNGGQEWQLMAAIVQRLKTLAEKKNIVVIVIAQTAQDGSLARSKHMLDEADLWLNLAKLDEKDEAENAPFNFALEVKKSRSVSGNADLLFKYCGQKMIWTDEEEEARNLKEFEDKNEEK